MIKLINSLTLKFIIQTVKKPVFLLAVITILASLLRLYDLANVPMGLHGDEASIGYSAYSLLKTGKDQNGVFLPLSIDQFGDYRPAGYHYVTVPFVFFLGLNELAVRLPAALFGIATIPALYFLVLAIFKKHSTALIGGLLIALSPWHIIISRSTSEGVVAMFLIISGSAVILNQKKNRLMILLAAILFLLSLFFYHSARIFTPIIFPIVALFSIKNKYETKTIGILTLSYGFILLTTILLLFIGKGSDRPLEVSIFNIPGGHKEITQQIGEDGTQAPILTRLFHNKILYFGKLFLTSYFKHYSGEFLFLSNGYPLRYIVPWSGNLYLPDLFFLLFGGSLLLASAIKKNKIFFFPLLWIVLGGVPAGLTWEDIPNIQRASLMIPAIIMITSYGINICIEELFRKKVKLLFVAALSLIYAYSSVVFLHNYFYHSKTHEPWHRSASIKTLMQQLKLYSHDYKKIIMTTELNNNFIFYLFYNKVDPSYFHSKGSPKEHDGLHFDAIVYTHNPCPIAGKPDETSTEEKTTLFVDKFDCSLPKNAKILETIRHPDQTNAHVFVAID